MKKIMVILLIFGLLALFVYPTYIKNTSTLLVVNMMDKSELPNVFRMEPEIQSSGSGQFSEKSLDVLLKTIPSKNLLIVDLRMEPHGFINGTAVSWYGSNNWYYKDKTIEEIERIERENLEGLHFTLAYRSKQYPWPFFVNRVATEEELLKIPYLRLPVQDHVRPTDATVARFIDIYKTLPKETWVHYHCSKGRGRTTTLLTMVDIIKNGHQDSLETITKRQEALGGLNLLAPPLDGDWKKPYIIERTAFIKKFYQYIKDHPNLDIPWSTYSER